LNRGGIKIGIFSLLGKEADDNAAYAPPVTFSKPFHTARKMVNELLEEKCDMIICLSHSGVTADGKGGWKGEDIELAEKVKGIDIIISAHSHSVIGKPLIVNNIPIVQTGEYGQNVGKLSVTLQNGIVSIDEYALIPVDDKIPGDPSVHWQIEEQKKMVTSEILEPLGMNYDSPVAETDFPLECDENGDMEESNLGPMVADAIYGYVNRFNKKGTDISMVAVGVIRDNIVPGFQTAPDIFRIMSMGTGKDNVPGYPLARLYVTGKELKSILEILQVAYKSTPANFCYYSGIKADYDPGKGMLRKIKKIEIIHHDGTASLVDISKKNKTLYSITANSYMLEFFGIIKKMSFGLINVVPKDYEGNKVENMKDAVIDMDESKQGIQEGKEWLAILSFLSTMKDTNGNGIPDIDKKYSGPVKSFFAVKK
jgi:5'-nucleotidase